MIVLELPYPPSVNHHWRRVGHRTLISKEGRLFRKRVLTMLSVHHREPLAGRLHVRVLVYPPDRRRRDLDNIIKALFDALEHGGVYENDSQIDRLTIERGEVFKGGKAVVEITEVHSS